MGYTDHSFFKQALSFLIIWSSALLVVAGCAGTVPTTTVHEDSLSKVFLEDVSDKSYRAAHPLRLPQETVADVLRGLHTKKKHGLVLLFGKALRSTNLNDIRAFNEDEIALLTPPITTALAQAAPNQRVGFRLYSAAEISQAPKFNQKKRDTTSGYFFADGLSLHFTMTQYRYNPGNEPSYYQKDPRPLPDNDGLRDREVTFLPEAALRADVYDRSSWIGKSEDRSLAIDYQLLTKILAAPPPPPTPPPPAQPAPAAAQQAAPPSTSIPPQAQGIGKNDPDLQAFKEELKALQQKLDEQKAELQRLKNTPPKKK